MLRYMLDTDICSYVMKRSADYSSSETPRSARLVCVQLVLSEITLPFVNH